MAAPIAAMLIKGTVGRFFKQDVPHAVREAKELAGSVPYYQEFLGALQGAKSIPDLYEAIVQQSSGYFGGSAPRAVGVQYGYPTELGGPGTFPPELAKELTAKGWLVPSKADPNAMGAAVIGRPLGIINAPTLTVEGFREVARRAPNLLVTSAQLGVTPSMLDPVNKAVRDVIGGKMAEFGFREDIRPILPAFSRTAGVVVTEDDVVRAARRAREGGVDTGAPAFADLLRQAERERAAEENKRAAGEEPSVWSGFQDRPTGAMVGFPEMPEIAHEDVFKPASQAGFAFVPGVGWQDTKTGDVLKPAPPLPPPVPFSEPSTAALPPPTPPPAPGPRPDEQPNAPSMQRGGTVPSTGLYRLHEGERVVPAQRQMDERDVPGASEWKPPAPYFLPPQGGQFWPGMIEPPVMREDMLRPEVPRRFGPWPHDEKGGETEPTERVPSSGLGASATPEGRWYLDPKAGRPFEAGSNPEPSLAWRLVFDADQLQKAWERRAKDGDPLLVPHNFLARQDWPTIAERARITQYVAPDLAVEAARAFGSSVAHRETVQDEPLPQSPEGTRVPGALGTVPMERSPGAFTTRRTIGVQDSRLGSGEHQIPLAVPGNERATQEVGGYETDAQSRPISGRRFPGRKPTREEVERAILFEIRRRQQVP